MKIRLCFLILALLLTTLSSPAFVKSDEASRAAKTICSEPNVADDTLTEDIVKQVLTDNYVTQFKSDYPKGVKVEFGPISIAAKREKIGLIRKGETTTVYPVKVLVTIKATRYDGSVSEVKRGESPNEAFYFYLTEFNEWSFRIGSAGN